MTKPEEIKLVISKIKSKRQRWNFVPRPKNFMILNELGISQELLFDEIFKNITWRNYYRGPLTDNHTPKWPGDIWIFGLEIMNINCYLKISDMPNDIYWISIHVPQFKMNLPYS